MDDLHKILQIDKKNITPKTAGARRLDRVNEAIMSWAGGTQEKKNYHEIWADEEYAIKLGKPGKEAAIDYDRCKYKDGHIGNNPNDMLPSIFEKGTYIEDKSASFKDVFNEPQALQREKG